MLLNYDIEILDPLIDPCSIWDWLKQFHLIVQ